MLRSPFSPTMAHEVVHQVNGFLGVCLARRLVRTSRALHALVDPYLKDVDSAEYADVDAAIAARARGGRELRCAGIARYREEEERGNVGGVAGSARVRG